MWKFITEGNFKSDQSSHRMLLVKMRITTSCEIVTNIGQPTSSYDRTFNILFKNSYKRPVPSISYNSTLHYLRIPIGKCKKVRKIVQSIAHL